MKTKKQPEQTNDTANELSSDLPDWAPLRNVKTLPPTRQTRSPQPEGAPEALIPPTQKEADNQVIAPDGEPHVNHEPNPLF